MSTEEGGEVVSLLLIEDDPEDVEITRRALQEARVLNPLYVVRDGEEALEFLRHTGRYSNPAEAPRPGLILLDLNLPRLDGREVLKQIKADPGLRRIPVVVLTTSNQQADISECYNHGANTYVTKPVEFDKFLQAIITVGQYWLCIAEIPGDEGCP